jgi:transposase
MLSTPVWHYRQEGRRSQPFFGFMPLKGTACVEVLQKADAKAMEAFLEKIRKQHNDERPIGLVLDNARIHHAHAVKQKAIELDIHLLFLPPYSPKFNPIEFLWKDGKKILAKEANFNHAKVIAPDIFLQLMRQRALSYARSWIKQFVC